MPETIEELSAKLNAETARITWSELHKPFARGVVIQVASSLDLIDVASCVARDDKATVEAWLQCGQISRLSDEGAQDWHERNPVLWAVVVAPWVLVQERAH